ncbi:MAG: TetR family transcriptional regulator, partial [Rickettsiales bacterium]|nr:TetR family transcriptional regulator [Rickettsiales bacterium]
MDIKDDVSEIILNSAKTIFARYGFKKTTMDEIAQA